ncbi:MAG TPA: HPr-rel-A system PqqD family peptide chaperone [Allosphingosinicella sp.]|jgi:PqqD family protein of HPr-rel-A system
MTGPIYTADTEGCRAVELEGLTLLFHPRSGMTHILAPPSPEILEALGAEPGDAAAVVERLRARFDLSEEDAAAAVTARLGELEASGLVKRA